MTDMSQTADPVARPVLKFTGERYTPETEGNIYLEHMHRYLLARDLVAGRDVLDIASGEGFGSHALSRLARSVVGVDIDSGSVEHAQSRYRAENLEFRVGSCSSIPLADHTVDVVVSFETIEHHDEHEQMMREVKRVLRPGGLIVISSPEKREYTDVPGTRNPYHVKELYRAEFEALMHAHFAHVAMYGQRVVFGSALFLEGSPNHLRSTDSHTMVEADGLLRPIYLVAVASDADLPELPASGLFEEDVLRSEVVGVRFRALEAERDALAAELTAERDALKRSLEAERARSAAALRAIEKAGHRSLSPRTRAARRAVRRLFSGAEPERPEQKGETPAPESSVGPKIDLLFPIGHFYSPIADPEDIAARKATVFRPREGSPGIDYRVEEQLQLLRALAPHAERIDYPVEDPGDGRTYFYANDQYPVLDAEFLHAALCHFRPGNMVEIGSGFSSLITANVNRSVLGGSLDFTCVEPYPRQFLRDGVEGITNLVISRVEDMDIAFFDRLGDGDVLFIDSSHVSKVGSDVNYLFFEVIPRLKPGVMVHVHDIFLPDEYPEQWALHQNRNWNEQYVLQGFLQFNAQWEVLWAAHLMGTRHREAVQKVFPRYPSLGGGGSFWFRRR
jgi:SAM-dependent methyltransferase